jgi:hypothetical protein
MGRVSDVCAICDNNSGHWWGSDYTLYRAEGKVTFINIALTLAVRQSDSLTMRQNSRSIVIVQFDIFNFLIFFWGWFIYRYTI